MTDYGASVVIDADGLSLLMTALVEAGHKIVGPSLKDGAIVLEQIAGLEDLPRGWLDEQEGGHYRLHKEGDAYFGYTVGPTSWKHFLHPSHQQIWSTETREGTTTIKPEPVSGERYAFFGVRACELAAIAIQDKVFLEDPYIDPRYAARRKEAFLIAVNCARAVATCFCTSMNSGPKANSGYDIALTEIATGDNAEFLAEAGSEKGATYLANLPSRASNPKDIASAVQATANAEAQISRKLDTENLPELLKSNPDHPRWDDVASRCLNCSNCTMVCPTCFCTTVDEVSDLEGVKTSRVQRWASCFTSDFSYVHGGAVRETPVARYRQWMTHKLATWQDQFETSGCTGCGRCIAWCPVGIDITEEAAAIRGQNQKT